MKFCALISACLLAACVESGGNHPTALDASEPTEAGACQDSDNDGYGEGCAKGGDCNDADAKVHTGCARCVTPEQGCDCKQGAPPVSCYLTPSRNEEGALMCHEGTRYCRDQAWSACESVVSYPKPAATESEALIKSDAGPVHCNDCNVNCYVVRDNLDPVDAGFDASSLNTVLDDGGGLSLKYIATDAAVVTTDAGTFDPSTCVLGTAPDHDCDGIPDKYDPYPNQKPFATTNPTLFLDIAPGETGTGVINVQFYLNSADVYFLIDQTGSMQEESDRLKTDLTTGDFVNNAAYNCSDYDFDFKPNNELKAQGIVGAIRCIIRDANFGVGYFREIPFSPVYGPNNTTMFRNLQDITTSIPSVITGVSQLTAVNNIDWPEADMVALYSVATGSGAYFGTDKPGLPARTNCPGTAWGYPCFRANAIPVVIMFTDAMMHNGPSNNAYPYLAANLGINKGTTASYTSVTSTNENSATAYDLGDVTNTLKTYIGSTTTMASDLGYSAVTCGSSARPDSPDAMFKFTVASTKTVTLASAGSDFGTTISLYNAAPGVVTTLPALPNTNDGTANAYSFGDVGNKYLQATGSTSTLNSDYSTNDVSCSAYPAAKDATFTFNVSQATRVALDTTSSTIGTVVSLFSSAPTATSYTAVANTNDSFANAYSVGALDGKSLGFSGDSSAAGILATYSGAQLGCGSAPADSATDAVYTFSLASAKRVRISAEDTTFGNAIALMDNSGSFPITSASANTNELEASATDVGALDGKMLQYTGSTAAMAANYPLSTIGCNAGDTSRDAVYKFSLTGTKTVSLDTSGSGYDTTLALFRNSITGSSTPIALTSNANETGQTAYDIGTVNNNKYVITGGNSSSMDADYTSAQIGCSTTNSSAHDAVFHFHLNTATQVHIDTTSTSYDALLSLHNAPLPDLVSTAIANTNEDGGSSAYPVTVSNTAANLQYTGSTSSMSTDITITSPLCTAAGRDAVFKLVVPVTGNYQLDTIGSGFDTVLALYTTSAVNANLIACDNDGGGSTTSKITRSLTAGTYYIVVKGLSKGKNGPYKLNIQALDYINSANRIACDDDSAGSSQAKIEQNLAAGDYYVVVKGHSSSAAGSYQLTVSDMTTPPVPTEITCNDDVSGSSNSSFISQTLSAGTYYVVVKGHLTASGAYTLNMKDTAVTTATSLQCDTGSGALGTSLIERNLTAGTYRVIFKGKASTNKGAYKLIFRDLTALPNNQRIGCDHNSGTSGKSHYEADLTPGTYTAVVKGDSATAGAYKLSVRDATNVPSGTSLQCDHNTAADGSSIITRSLTPGTYYAAVKGYYTEDDGQYQLTIGGAAATTGTYVPPTWAQTLAALQAKQVRVMPVLSCHDDTAHGNSVNGDCNLTRTQATALANATGALGGTLQPLVFDISKDGSGLSTSVVQGIAALAHYLSMDVQVRVVFDPDANPGFGLTIKAVDTPGDGCSGVVGIEHTNCAPGATPRFEISFNNPLSHPVPLNPNDPNGGYNFRAELIGDNEFIVDRVPIYIVPRDVSHPPVPVPKIVSTGSYWQTVAAPGCVGNQRPDWHDLSWTADIPNGTSVGFSVCASDKATDLTTCPLTSLCTVTGGGTCMTDANCTNGYCSTSGNCQTVTAGACTSDMQCTSGATCRSNKCTFAGQPVYIGGVLGSANYEANLRMQISMTANTADNTGPTMHDWSLTYVCNNIL